MSPAVTGYGDALNRRDAKGDMRGGMRALVVTDPPVLSLPMCSESAALAIRLLPALTPCAHFLPPFARMGDLVLSSKPAEVKR